MIMVWIAYASIWLSTALAVSTGIYVTGEWFPLFFMIIPLFVRINNKTINYPDVVEKSKEER